MITMETIPSCALATGYVDELDETPDANGVSQQQIPGYSLWELIGAAWQPCVFLWMQSFAFRGMDANFGK